MTHTFLPPQTYPCPCCYRPVEQRGYCESCTTAGHAKTHAARAAQPKVIAITTTARPLARVTVPGTSPGRHPGVTQAKPKTRTRTPQLSLDYRRDRLVDALQQYTRETGRVPTTSRWQAEHRRPAHTEAYKLFGNWRNALAAAGIHARNGRVEPER